MKNLGLTEKIITTLLSIVLSLAVITVVLLSTLAIDIESIFKNVSKEHGITNVVDAQECTKLNDINSANECVLKEIINDMKVAKDFSPLNETDSKIEYLTEKPTNNLTSELNNPIFLGITFFIFLSGCVAHSGLVAKLLFSKNLHLTLKSWAIDSPPVLGVCGTLYSLIQYLGALDGQTDTSGFLEAFSFAAVTTLLGAVVSVVNHFALSISSVE